MSNHSDNKLPVTEDLSESYRKQIEDVIKELQEMSVKELKSVLQERDLPVSGNKTTMIERIVDSLKK